jgi:UDP-glucose 4-epimerase
MVRDYVYVEDLVRMIVPFVGRETEFDLYNLGSGQGYSVTEVFESLRRVTDIEFAIDVRPVPATFVDHVVLNTDRYRREFDGSLLTPRVEGVRLT